MRKTLVLFSAFALVGCSERNFNRPEWLKAPRVLAVQAEPPQPAFGAATTLRALIYQPQPLNNAAQCSGQPTSPSYHWSWCPLPTTSANNYACPVNQTQLNQLFAALGVAPAPSMDLGTGETATLVNPFPASLLRDMCKGNVGLFSSIFGGATLPNRPDGGGGSIFSCGLRQGDDPSNPQTSRPLSFPVTVTLAYTPPCGSPPQDNFGDTLTTVFTVHLPTDESVPPNHNPTLGELLVTSGVDADGGVPLSAIRRDAGLAATVDVEMSPDAAELSADGGDEVTDGGGEAQDGGHDGGHDGGQDGGIGILDSAGAAPTDAGQPVAGGAIPPDGGVLLGSIPIQRQKRVGLWLELPVTSAERLLFPSVRDELNEQDTQGNVTKHLYYYERLSVSWFAETGDFGSNNVGGRRTGYQPPIDQTDLPATTEKTMDEMARNNFWVLPKVEDYDKPSARIIVVVRDSRGGVTWLSTTTELTAEEKQP